MDIEVLYQLQTLFNSNFLLKIVIANIHMIMENMKHAKATHNEISNPFEPHIFEFELGSYFKFVSQSNVFPDNISTFLIDENDSGRLPDNLLTFNAILVLLDLIFTGTSFQVPDILLKERSNSVNRCFCMDNGILPVI
jgi:hypothetical protein